LPSLSRLAQNISQGPVVTNSITTYGVVTALSADSPLSFQNCLFQDNNFQGFAGATQGYMVSSSGASIDIQNTCFLNNKLQGFGTVQAFMNASYKFSNVFGAQNTSKLNCPFLAVSSKTPQDNIDVVCKAYDASGCRAHFDFLTNSPTFAPASAMTATPSTIASKPTIMNGPQAPTASVKKSAAMSLSSSVSFFSVLMGGFLFKW
jgi:hypothetical protein